MEPGRALVEAIAELARIPAPTFAEEPRLAWVEERLADLPGYGYAKVPQAQRAQWRQLVGDYLESRPTLAGVVVIMDARHPFMPLDRQLLQWLGDLRRLVVLSKADKLSRSEGQRTLAAVHRHLEAHFAGASAQLFSATAKTGLDDARALLARWLFQPVATLNDGDASGT